MKSKKKTKKLQSLLLEKACLLNFANRFAELCKARTLQQFFFASAVARTRGSSLQLSAKRVPNLHLQKHTVVSVEL